VIVLDTHAWVWSVDAPQRLPKAVQRAIDGADRIGIPTMSVFEFVQLVERRRIRLTVPARAWVRDALSADRVETLPLTAQVALAAAQLPFEGDPADRIIYATARVADARLVTRDERLRAFDPDLTLW
jgi:PIN domain nuclease of toxin-antitoxin system